MPNEPILKEAQPKINAKRSVRTLVYVLILGAAGFCVRWYVQNRNDPTGSFGTVNSEGMIAAIKFLNEGQEVVAIDSKGTVIEPAGYRQGAVERDMAWQPDGNRLFFVSDRVGPGFQVYRWKPAEGSEPEVRSVGSLGKSEPTFPAETLPHGSDTLLMVSGGFVLELNPKDTSSHQILPPRSGEVPQTKGGDDEGGGQGGQFSMLYDQLGDSFRAAKWCFGKQAVAAVMRGDHGETLLIQQLPEGNDPTPRPAVVAMAERIDFDVSPVDGAVIFSATNVQVTDEQKAALKKAHITGGLIRHALGYWKEGDTNPHFISRVMDDKVAYGSPKVSPDGERVIVTAGSFDPKVGSMTPEALLSFPFSEEVPMDPNDPNVQGMVHREAVLLRGPVYNPSWSPTGKQIAYVKTNPAGKRAIFVINFDGTGERSVTGDTGDYAMPVFSPQKPASAKP